MYPSNTQAVITYEDQCNVCRNADSSFERPLPATRFYLICQPNGVRRLSSWFTNTIFASHHWICHSAYNVQLYMELAPRRVYRSRCNNMLYKILEQTLRSVVMIHKSNADEPYVWFLNALCIGRNTMLCQRTTRDRLMDENGCIREHWTDTDAYLKWRAATENMLITPNYIYLGYRARDLIECKRSSISTGYVEANVSHGIPKESLDYADVYLFQRM